MLPTEEQIRKVAYLRWEVRGGGHGHDCDDWYAAKEDLTIRMNYEKLAVYFLDESRPQYIGSKQHRQCRYCGSDRKTVKFKMIAHAVPEAIGNRSLIAHDECDACNKFFSETIEDSFGKLLLPMRTILAIAGKEGVPTYRSNDKRFRIDFNAAGSGFQIKDTLQNARIIDDVDGKKLRGSLHVQPHIPLRVFKCFSKCALAVMPPDELQLFAKAIAWILDPDDKKLARFLRGAGCFKYYLHDELPSPFIALLRRTTRDTPLPYMMVMLGTESIILHSFVPFSPMDEIFFGQDMVMPKMGSLVLPGGRVTHCEAIPLASADVVRDTVLDVELRYETRVETEVVQVAPSDETVRDNGSST